MIICPSCKEEIEDASHYCDQCGQSLRYCNRCGRVGMGRRCTSCGGLMVAPEEILRNGTSQSTSFPSQVSMIVSSRSDGPVVYQGNPAVVNPAVAKEMQSLVMTNTTLGIVIEGQDGAVIGRRQGPYAQFFQGNMYVSGLHAQLKYRADTGWCIVDKHSSNGTRLNDRPLQPDVEMALRDGDVVMIANINLQVSVK